MESSLQRFKGLQAELLQLLRSESFDEEVAHKKMSKYIALMVEDNPDAQERMFDHFCEFGGVEVLSRVMRGDPLLAVKCYSLLFINLRNEMWISFILCQPFLMEAISLRAPSHDEEYTEYFVSFLKSLSIRINHSQVTLFYNKKNCTFPLAMAAMHYHNHPDFMVRTSVMNILLQLMKIREPKTQIYFSRFPFTSYLVAFACEVARLVDSFHLRLDNPDLPAKHLTSYKVDLSDYLYYFNDLVQFATPAAVEVIERIAVAYLIVPTFARLLKEEGKKRLHALLVVHQLLRVLKSSVLLDTIAFLLLSPALSQQTLQHIQQHQQVLHPEVFTKEFDPASSYWGEYQQELVGHCLEVFRDVQKFEVSYQDSQHQPNPQFQVIVNTMSEFIGYDLLRGEALRGRLLEQAQEGQTAENPFKAILLQLLSPSLPSEHVVTTTILLNLTHNPNISASVLHACQLITRKEESLSVAVQKNRAEEEPTQKTTNEEVPTKDIEPVQECKKESQVQVMDEVKAKLISSIQQIRWEQTRIRVLSNTLRLLQQLLVESQQIQFEEELLKNYREITALLRQHANSDHMMLFVRHFALAHTLTQQQQQLNPCEISLPYPPAFLQQERWDEPYEEQALPLRPIDAITHFMQHFFLFRSFLTAYFNKFYEAEYADFSADYASTFLQTGKRWKKGEFYRISSRTLICCGLEGTDRRNKKALIVQDQFCFVLAELAEKQGCKILVNECWKGVKLEISKEDATWVEVTVGEGKTAERYKLVFEDQVRSGTTLVRLNDLQWQCFQFELAFIGRFLKAAAEE